MNYDISQAFESIENELIDSMMRNFKHHRAEEIKEDYNWTQWQAEELKSFEKYRKQNADKFSKQFSQLNGKISEMLKTARANGNASQEASILQAIKNGFKVPILGSNTSTAEFFKLNDRKLNALIKSTTDDLKRAEHAVLRMSNDKYRKAIYNAQVYCNSGAGTYEKAIDMACRDMLNAGLNCVEYKSGARHTLSDYADMALKTANKRAYLRGEGEKRAEWGISTVVVNSRQGGCPKCAQYIGRVYIDDVYSNGKKSDGNYPLLSVAIQGGLFHPRCKDSTSTYYEGISECKPVSQEEMAEMERREQLEQKQQYADRQSKRFARRAKYSLDHDNKRVCSARAEEWQSRAERLSESVAKSADGGIIELNKPIQYKSFDINDNDGYQNWVENYYSKNKPKLTQDDVNALKIYTDGSYNAINGVERFDKGSQQYEKLCRMYRVDNLDEYKQMSNDISTAIGKFELDDNIVCHRYVSNADYITGATSSVEDLIKTVGNEFTEKGYTSTCLFEHLTKKFGGKTPIHLEIRIPKKTKSAYINDFSEKKNLEFEYLLDRGTKFKVLDGGQRNIIENCWVTSERKWKDVEKTEKFLILEVLK